MDKLKTHLYHIFIFTAVLSVYLWSMPGTVVLEDDGLFLLVANFNGVAHPPGYPLYSLLSYLATWVPVGSIAARVHGFTAVLGALACICLYNVIRRLLPGNLYAAIAALTFGYSLTFWSQSIIAEVYSLNVLIFLLLLQLALTYSDSTDPAQRQRLLNWMGFLYGLGLCNHWPLLCLSTPVFLSILWPHRLQVLQQLSRSIVFGLIGLLPYAWMVWRSQMDPLISFNGPINTWQEFWFIISREGYASIDSSPSAGWQDKLRFATYVVLETSRQFTLVGLIPVAIGFLCQWWRWSMAVCIGLTLGYIGNTFVLIALLGFDYDFFHQNIFRVYPLVAYCICGIWLALGLKESLDWLSARSPAVLRRKLLQGMVAMLVVGTTFMVNLPENYRAMDTWIEDYARIILASLEENAVLFTSGDTDVWTIGYMHHVLRLRPDITLYSSKGNVYSNSLYRQYSLSMQEIEQVIRQFVQSINAPVYYTNSLAGNFGVIDFGLYKKINKYADQDYRQAVMLPGIRQYIETLLTRGEPVDHWEKMHYRMLLAEYCHLSIMLLNNTEDKLYIQDLQSWVNKVCDTYNGYLTYAELLLTEETPDLAKVSSLLIKADSLKYQKVLKAESAKYYYLNAELNVKQGESAKAIANFEHSYKQWSHPDNPALKRKLELEGS